MYIAGIDIGKFTHEVTILDTNGSIIKKAFKITNNHVGANKLMKYIKTLDSQDIIFGLEATGHYWLTLYCFLKKKGFTVNVINPIQSDSLRNLYIRQTKNDSKDSFIIAEVIRFGRFTTTNLSDENIFSLRQLCRYRKYLVDNISDLKRKTLCVLDMIFPEYPKLFSDVWGESSKAILSKYPSPEELLSLDIGIIINELHNASRGQLGYAKAEKIIESATSSFGINYSADILSFQIKHMMGIILETEKQLKILEEKIEELYNSLDCTLTSIPGIGITLATIIVSEIGDISRFKDAPSLVAFAGIDPTVKQSGTYNYNNNKMSKRGSPYLRRTLWTAAKCSYLYDPQLNAYYNKKCEEGKHHNTAIGAVCHKLTHIIYAIMRDNKQYVSH